MDAGRPKSVRKRTLGAVQNETYSQKTGTIEATSKAAME